MNRLWSRTRLNDVVKPVERATSPLPGTTYRQIGVKLWGEGAYERESIDGSQTKYARLFRAEAGDIVVNKIRARNGSVAVVNDALAGCYGSGEFPMFAPSPDRLESRWMHWLTKTGSFWAQCDEKSRGTSGQNRIRPERFLEIEIPLPPLAEQRRIGTRIEELADQIDEARILRLQAANEVKALFNNRRSEVFLPNDESRKTLNAVCAAIIDNLHTTPRYDGEDFFCIRSQDIGWGTINYATALKTNVAEFEERTRRAEPTTGDIVFVREGDVGRCAVIDGSRRFSLGQRVMMFRPSTQIDSRFLMHQLMSRPVLEEQILSNKTGTTSHHVNIKHLRTVKVNVPLLPEQRRIVAELDALQTEVGALKRLQGEIAAELDALLPAILDRAFKGQL